MNAVHQLTSRGEELSGGADGQFRLREDACKMSVYCVQDAMGRGGEGKAAGDPLSLFLGRNLQTSYFEHTHTHSLAQRFMHTLRERGRRRRRRRLLLLLRLPHKSGRERRAREATRLPCGVVMILWAVRVVRPTASSLRPVCVCVCVRQLPSVPLCCCFWRRS